MSLIKRWTLFLQIKNSQQNKKQYGQYFFKLFAINKKRYRKDIFLSISRNAQIPDICTSISPTDTNNGITHRDRYDRHIFEGWILTLKGAIDPAHSCTKRDTWLPCTNGTPREFATASASPSENLCDRFLAKWIFIGASISVPIRLD